MDSNCIQLLLEDGIYDYAQQHSLDNSIIQLVRICNKYLQKQTNHVVIEYLRERLPNISLVELLQDTNYAIKLFQFIYEQQNIDKSAPVLLDKIIQIIFTKDKQYNNDVCINKLIFWIDDLLLGLKSLQHLRKHPNYAECLFELVSLANHLQIKYPIDYQYLQKTSVRLAEILKLLLDSSNNWEMHYPQFPYQCNIVLMGIHCLLYDDDTAFSSRSAPKYVVL